MCVSLTKSPGSNVLKGTAVDQDHEVFLSFHKDTIDARLIKGKCSCGNPPYSM